MKTNVREIILRNSLELFNEKGYENVTMREIAAACGIAVGNLTYYFPQKETIAKELMAEPVYLDDDPPETYEEYFFVSFRKMLDALQEKSFYFKDPGIGQSFSDFYDHSLSTNRQIHAYFVRIFRHMRDLGLFTFTDEELPVLADLEMAMHLKWNSDQYTVKKEDCETRKDITRRNWIFLKRYAAQEHLEEYQKLSESIDRMED